jgi:hypothetical protein
MRLENVILVITALSALSDTLVLANTKIDKKGRGVILQKKEVGEQFANVFNNKEFNANGKRYRIIIEETDAK